MIIFDYLYVVKSESFLSIPQDSIYENDTLLTEIKPNLNALKCHLADFVEFIFANEGVEEEEAV